MVADEGTIGYSLIGFGGIGFVHAWAVSVVGISFNDVFSSNIKLIGVYNRTLSKAEWAKKKFGFKYATSDWREILRDNETNAIAVTTPNSLHEEPVIEAADAGINILCEKPLGATYEQARRMYDAVTSKNIINSVALVMRFMPSVIFAKKYIGENKLGQIYHFRAVVGHSRYVNPDLSIEWRMRKEIAGGGALADIGIHLVDLAIYLVGDIRSVSALTKTFIKKRPSPSGKLEEVDVDDAALMIFEFENNAIGSVEASRFAPGFQELDRIEIHGSKGMIRFFLENPFEVYVYNSEEERAGVKRIILKPWDRALWPPSKSVEGWAFLFVKLYHEFFKGILENRKVKPDFYDGLKAQEVVEAAYISAEEKRWVDLPL